MLTSKLDISPGLRKSTLTLFIFSDVSECFLWPCALPTYKYQHSIASNLKWPPLTCSRHLVYEDNQFSGSQRSAPQASLTLHLANQDMDQTGVQIYTWGSLVHVTEKDGDGDSVCAAGSRAPTSLRTPDFSPLDSLCLLTLFSPTANRLPSGRR